MEPSESYPRGEQAVASTEPVDRTWQTINIDDFVGASRDRQNELIPNGPGLYLWTHNLNALVGESPRVIQQELVATLGRLRGPRTAVVKPYYEIQIRDHRLGLHDTKRLLLRDAFHARDVSAQWIAEMATVFQRPLYAGMATRLRTRIRQHLGQESTLRSRLQEANIDMLTLAVTWIEAPKSMATSAPSEAPEDDDTEADTEEIVDEDVSPSPATAGSLDATLKAAESLLIRLSMPMFNEVQS